MAAVDGIEIEMIEKLQPGEYIYDGKTYHVQASHLTTKDTFYFACPFCWSAYKKNGERTLRSKRVFHRHSGPMPIGHPNSRSPHCAGNRDGKHNTIMFTIWVTKLTLLGEPK